MARPEGADHGHDAACVKGVAAITSRGAGTSTIARSRNVAAKSASGRRPGGRPNTARLPRQSPPRPSRARAPPAGQERVPGCSRTRGCAGAWSRSSNFFSPPLCDRPGCHESPVTSLRNPARYCCPACRQAVRNVQDRERKWLARGTLDGRKKRAIEYQAARWRRSPRHCNTSAPASSRPPPQ